MAKSFDVKSLATMDIKDISKLFQKKKEAEPVVVSKAKKASSKPVVSFDFGNESIKVVVGRAVKDEVKVTRIFQIPLRKGMIQDGVILDANKLKSVIIPALSQNKVSIKDVVCCINSTQVITREIFIPVVTADEIETVARYEIQQFLPIDLANYLVQYIILGEEVVHGDQKLKLNVIVFPEKMARSYYELFQEIGLKPYMLDVSFNAVGKLAQFEQLKQQEATVAYIDMGAQSVDVNVYSQQNIQFTRMIKTGGSVIDKNLCDIPNMLPKSAVALKIERADLTKAETTDMHDRIIKYSVDEMLVELDRVLQFYNNKHADNSISKLYIYGGTSHIKGMAQYMENRFNLPVSLLETLDSVDVPPVLKKDLMLGDYTNALGAIIRY